jgi:four helix bundle protein
MNTAEGSLEETRYYLILAQDLGYANTGELIELLNEAGRLLKGYSRAIVASGL